MASRSLKTLDSPDSYTIAWIAALPIERAAAVAMLDEEHKQPKRFSPHQADTNSYTWGRIGEHNIVIVSLAAGVYGLGSAAATASSLSSSLPAIRVGLLVGIGGGIARPDEDHDIRLGDVVVSQPDGTTGGVCQYDLVKAKPGDIRERKGFLAAPPRVLLNAIANIQAIHELRDSEIPRFLQDMLEANPKMAKKTKKNPGYTHPGFENDRLFQSSYAHVTGPDCRSCETAKQIQREERESTDPEIHYGIIASGNTLVKDAVTRDQIVADVGEDCICFEMEAAGLMNHFPCLVIRGICDYADSHKNDRWQRYAACTAAAYAKELLAYVPPAEIHEAKRALEILESVDSILLYSHGQKLRKWLAAPDPKRNANYARELRHEGTGAWLLDNTAFKKWMSGTYKHLWLRGIPGCGKTVLSTTVLDHLIEGGDDRTILNFFFDFSDPTKQTKDGLLRSLAFQLYQGLHDAAGHLDNSFRAHKYGDENPSTTTLEEIVDVILAAQSKVMIVLDALDESTATEEILLWLGSVFSNPRLEQVQIFYTSREAAEFMQSIPNLIGDQCCLFVDIGAIDSDIRSYVNNKARYDTGFTKKKLSENLLERIHHKVGNGANGMFRWAACQLDSLSRCLSPNEIAKTLDRLPTTLEETYDRMLESIPDNYRKSAMRLLQFIVYANRPLTLKEAVEIVATEIEEKEPRFDVGCRMFDDNDVLRHCPSLVSVVVVKNESETIQELHLAHFSVKEYLLLRREFGRIDASISIIKTCLTYLRDIEGDRWKLARDFPLALYAAEIWLEFAGAVEESEDVLAIIAAFLRQEKTFQRWIYLYEADDEETPRRSAFYYACLGGLTSITRSMIDEGVDVNSQQEGLYGNTLQAASFFGHVGVVRLLLDNNANASISCGKYGTALQAACHKGHIGIVRLLLERNVAVDTQGGKFGNALQAASFFGHLDIVQLLLEKNADVNIQCGEYGTALQAASSNGCMDIIRLLLERNAAVCTRAEVYGNALIAASANGQIEAVELLLEHSADFDGGKDFHGNLIEAACANGHLDIVKLLLERGMNPPKARSCGGALKAACSSGRYELVQLLLGHGVGLHEKGPSAESILEAAITGGNWKIVKRIIDLGADINAPCGFLGSMLQTACAYGSEEIVSILIDHGADVNAWGGIYGSPLGAACYGGNKEIVEILRKSNADVTVLVQDFDNLLDSACQADSPHLINLLVDFGVDLAHHSGIDGYLQRACFSGRQYFIKALVAVGVNVNHQGGNYGSPLQAACAGNAKDTVLLLLELGAVIDNGSELGSALHTAASTGNDTLVEMLVALGADVDALGSGSVDSTNALLAASDKGHSNVVRILLNYGADRFPRDKYGRTPLDAAVLSGHVDVARLLVAETNTDAATYGHESILHASISGHVKMVEFLLDEGFDASDAGRDGLTPLFAASLEGRTEVVNLLLDRGADVSMVTRGYTPLHASSLLGHFEVVKLLTERGANLSAAMEDLGTPLHIACFEGQIEVVEVLLERGANPSVAMKNGETPLHMACLQGQVEVVKLLLERGSNLSIAMENGATPLHSACVGGQVEVVRLLLEMGAGISIAAENGVTPLYLACMSGQVEVLRLLLERRDADISPGAEDMCILLQIACHEGQAEVLQLLMERDEDISVGAENRWALLEAACHGGQVEVLVMLLERDVDISMGVGYACGFTPLIFASYQGYADIVAQLLQSSGLLLHHKDTIYGRSALSHAVGQGHESVVKKLLMAPSINIDITDNFGRTALHLASIEGHGVIVRLILSHGTSVNLPDHYGSTALSFAARAGHSTVVEILLAAGATSTCQDCFRRTPIWWAKKCGDPEVATLLSPCGAEREETIGTSTEPEVGTRRYTTSIAFCDICFLDISGHTNFYSCSVCLAGNMAVCGECFASGGRCLVGSHTLSLKQIEPKAELEAN